MPPANGKAAAGKLNPPLGTDVINLPPGAELCRAGFADAPWPVLKMNERNPAMHFKGYVLDDKDRPIFHYMLDVPGGDVDVQEQALPVLTPGQGYARAGVPLEVGHTAEGPVLPGGIGQEDRRAIEPGVWTIDDTLTVTAAAERPRRSSAISRAASSYCSRSISRTERPQSVFR